MSHDLTQGKNQVFESSRLKILSYNDAFEDPGFLVELATGFSVLLDLGNLSSLSVRQLSRVRLVCVSHTHMDHFFGFDQFIRATLHEKKTIYFLGPVGLSGHIACRMRGYLWDLIDRDHFHFVVTELSDSGEVKSFSIKSSNDFNVEELVLSQELGFERFLPPSSKPLADLYFSDQDELLVSAVSCTHSSSCLVFRLGFAGRVRFDATAAKNAGITLGPWVNLCKRLFLEKNFTESIDVPGLGLTTVESIAKNFMDQDAPFTIAYITDIESSSVNLERLEKLFRDVDFMLIETNYQDDDHLLAKKNKHLTLSQGVEVAKACGARAAYNFHFSKRYKSVYTEDGIRSQFFEGLSGN